MNSPLAHTISVMQVIWGGRWQVGSACSTGEEVEQINSHVSRCGNTTKGAYNLSELTGLEELVLIGVNGNRKTSSRVYARGNCAMRHADIGKQTWRCRYIFKCPQFLAVVVVR